MGEDLLSLRTAIRDAHDVCTSTALGSCRSAKSLFAVLLELVSAGGTVGFDEEAKHTSWETVQQLIEMAELPCVDKKSQEQSPPLSQAVSSAFTPNRSPNSANASLASQAVGSNAESPRNALQPHFIP